MAKSAAKTSGTGIAPVMVVAGDELFLRNQHLKEIEKAVFGGEDPGMGYVRLDPTSLGGEAMAIILDEARTSSMFAPKKLVVVDPADVLLKKAGDGDDDDDDDRMTNREILENYLEGVMANPGNAASTMVLVFKSWPKGTRLHKALDKLGAVKWCESIKEFQAAGWVTRRAKEAYGKTMDAQAAGRLAELIGPDLQRLDNELAKLSLYEPDGPTITQKAVDALVGFQHEQQIWDMIEALAERDAPTALRKIEELWGLDPKIEYSATGAVFSWLNQVIKARELVDRRMPDAVIGKELKLWPPERAQKVLTLARSWGLAGAARWSEAMLAVDVANKSSLGEPRRNLEKFVVMLCAG
jgi:DNA polymerase III delta subunit